MLFSLSSTLQKSFLILPALPWLSREVGVHIDVVGALHLPQVTPVAHGHHAVDAEELHAFCWELPLLTLPLGCARCSLNQSCPLQFLDLGAWGGRQWGGDTTWTPRDPTSGKLPGHLYLDPEGTNFFFF